MPERSPRTPWRMLFVVLIVWIAPHGALAAAGDDAQSRMTRDAEAGRPIVVHVVVALCDNVHPGIAPVPRQLGNGKEPRTNLYWGAMYGVPTFLIREGWTRLPATRPDDARILERAILVRELKRAGVSTPVIVVADAWDGAAIGAAIETFFEFASGGGAEALSLQRGSATLTASAGGAAHVVAYVGHDGLMDAPVKAPAARRDAAPASSSIVLACASKQYFGDTLRAVGSHRLLLTTGLMAPEAYTLDAAIRTWVTGGTLDSTREAAAAAYDRYQKCGLPAARRLFWGDSQ